VDREADEAAWGRLGIAAVQADPHPHLLAARPRSRLEAALDLQRRGRGGRRLVEDAEELVAAAVDLAPARLRERAPLQLARLGEHAGVVPLQPLGEAARVLHVAEEEGERHGRLPSAAPRN